MAGNLPGFDPDGFRDAIRFAMTIGLPPDVEQQATFYFPKVVTATAPLDPSGVPYAPGTPVARTPQKAPVRVPCGIEDASGDVAATGLGRFGDGIIVTLLDKDYEAVLGFEFVSVGGVRYDYARELIPRGLGTVGIHRLLCTGEGSR